MHVVHTRYESFQRERFGRAVGVKYKHENKWKIIACDVTCKCEHVGILHKGRLEVAYSLVFVLKLNLVTGELEDCLK